MTAQSLITIVLADDHAAVRAGTRQLLESDAGLRVVAEASDGNEALSFAQAMTPDVLILDIQMPGKSGIEVARQVRALKLRCGILMVSAFDDAPYVKSALHSGANGYVLKTADVDELIQAVRDVHAGLQVLDKRITDARRAENAFAHPAQPQDAPDEILSTRERQVLQHIARGMTNKAIGMTLDISERTVQNHIAHIFDKLGAESRTDAVMIALRSGLIVNT